MARIDYTSTAIEDDARRKLSRIWAAASQNEKNRIARRLGYRGSPDSNRRVVRRLIVSRLDAGSKLVVTDYFKPFVTAENPDPFLGEYPPFKLPGLYQINSKVMVVSEKLEGTIALSTHINGWRASNKIKVLIDEYNFQIGLHLEGKKRRKRRDGKEGFEIVQSYDRVLGIAFSQQGALDLIAELFERGFIRFADEVIPPIDSAEYGVVISPTKQRYTVDPDTLRPTRQPFTETTARTFPRNPERRKDMIQYIRRSYGQKFGGNPT